MQSKSSRVPPRKAIFLGITSLISTLLLLSTGCGGGRDLSEESGRGQVQYLEVNGSYLGGVDAISADGSAVVGQTANDQIFRWSVSGEVQEVKSPDGRKIETIAMSANGSVITGHVYKYDGAASRPNFPFRWSVSGGMQYLEIPGAKETIVKAISADGSTMVGYSKNASGDTRAFRWTVNSGMQDLGTLGGKSAEATAVSANGAIVAGGSATKEGQGKPFLWTELGGMQEVTVPYASASALNVSDDGSSIMGYFVNNEGVAEYFRWTRSGGAKNLGTIGQVFGGGQYTVDRRISRNASAIVGSTQYGSGVQPESLLWTESGGLEKLGTMGRERSFALAVSEDGSTVVGDNSDSTGMYAYRWTRSGGMQQIELPDRGISRATHTSSNGSIVYGYILTTTGESRIFRWSKK